MIYHDPDEPDQVAAIAIARGFTLLRNGLTTGDAYRFQVWTADDGTAVTVAYKMQPAGQLTVEQVSWAKPNAKGRKTYSLAREPSLLAPDHRRRGLERMMDVFDRERDLPKIGDPVRVDPRHTLKAFAGRLGRVVDVIIPETRGFSNVSVRVELLEGPDAGWSATFFPSQLVAPGEVV